MIADALAFSFRFRRANEPCPAAGRPPQHPGRGWPRRSTPVDIAALPRLLDTVAMGAVPSYAYGPSSSFEDRLKFVFTRTADRVGPEARAELARLASVDSLKIVAGVLLAWIVAHAFGLGEVIDAVLLVGGALSVGWAIFEGIDHLYEFAKLTYTGRSVAEFEMAADHLAKAIAILGIQAVLAVIFRGAKGPRTGRGGRLNVGPAPAEEAGLRYQPKLIESAAEKAGPASPTGGATSPFRRAAPRPTERWSCFTNRCTSSSYPSSRSSGSTALPIVLDLTSAHRCTASWRNCWPKRSRGWASTGSERSSLACGFPLRTGTSSG